MTGFNYIILASERTVGGQGVPETSWPVPVTSLMDFISTGLCITVKAYPVQKKTPDPVLVHPSQHHGKRPSVGWSGQAPIPGRTGRELRDACPPL